MAIALPRSHRLAGRRSVRLAELSDERWIAGNAHNNDRTLSPLRLPSETEPRIDFIVGEWTTKLGLVAAGLGITLVPSLATRASRADIALVPLHRDDRASRSVYAATAKHRTRSPSVDAFANILAAHAQVLRNGS